MVAPSKNLPRREREVGDGVPVVEDFHIRPILFGLPLPGTPHGRPYTGHMAALGDRQGDLAVELLRERLIDIGLLTRHDGPVGPASSGTVAPLHGCPIIS